MNLEFDLFDGPPAAPEVLKDATLSGCGCYRYRLSRIWKPEERRVLWIMLNPSTADASVDDPTIAKCCKYAKRWGYGGIEVVNLFAWRATDPAALKLALDPVGPHNDAHIREAAAEPHNTNIVCAWGNDGKMNDRWLDVADMLDGMGKTLECFGLTQIGMPLHPLYLQDAADAIKWYSLPEVLRKHREVTKK